MTSAQQHIALVVTTIAHPTPALLELACGSAKMGIRFIVVGDVSSPPDFELPTCRYLDVKEQSRLGFRYAEQAPVRHYARKNIGYLYALREAAEILIETDDDNFPEPEFWSQRIRRQRLAGSREAGWLNVYRYFSDANIWPRGFPLERILSPGPTFESLPRREHDCPIQQGLADANPDVDAIYRLTMPLPQMFRRDRRVAIANESWCPFNSQNTTWWRDAAPLLYLPAYCSFRMTDIWRSFVALRICHENEWAVLFHEPTVRQERNEHNLMRDFADEIPGYLNNAEIRDALGRLSLRAGTSHIGENLRTCYEALVGLGRVDSQELGLLDAWLDDLNRIDAHRTLPASGAQYSSGPTAAGKHPA